MFMYNNFLPSNFKSADGIFFECHTDFREWMRFECLITDTDVPENMLVPLAIKLIFPNSTPPINEAISFIKWFYRSGKTDIKSTNNSQNSNKNNFILYNFEHDFDYIYSAFLQIYHIDIIDIPYLHWWKFSALLKGLHDCRFVEIMGYRNADINEDWPDNYKCHLLDLKETFALPLSVHDTLRRAKAFRFLNS